MLVLKNVVFFLMLFLLLLYITRGDFEGTSSAGESCTSMSHLAALYIF